MIAHFVLPVAGPQRCLDRTGQRHRPHRPLEERHVSVSGEAGEQRPAGGQRGAAAEENDDGEVGPGGLRGEGGVEPVGRGAAQCFLGHDGNGAAVCQRAGERLPYRGRCPASKPFCERIEASSSASRPVGASRRMCSPECGLLRRLHSPLEPDPSTANSGCRCPT